MCSLCICARLLSRLDASNPWLCCSARLCECGSFVCFFSHSDRKVVDDVLPVRMTEMRLRITL